MTEYIRHEPNDKKAHTFNHYIKPAMITNITTSIVDRNSTNYYRIITTDSIEYINSIEIRKDIYDWIEGNITNAHWRIDEHEGIMFSNDEDNVAFRLTWW